MITVANEHTYGCKCEACITRYFSLRSDFLRDEARESAELDAGNVRTVMLQAAALIPPDEQLQAERDAALDALSELLLAFNRIGAEFATTRQQRALRAAQALLVDAGRRLP